MSKKYYFFHGLFGHISDWDEFITGFEFSRGSLNYEKISLPGHGNFLFKDHPELKQATSFEEACSLYLPLFTQGNKNILVGYSMGGRIALYLFLTYPHLFSELILLSSSVGIKDLKEREKRRKSDELLFNESMQLKEFLPRWYEMPLFSNYKSMPSFSQHLQRKIERHIESEIIQCSRLMGAGMMPYLGNYLEGKKITYYYGEKDHKYKQLANDLPFKKKISIPESTHQLLFEHDWINYFQEKTP